MRFTAVPEQTLFGVTVADTESFPAAVKSEKLFSPVKEITFETAFIEPAG